MIFEFVGSVVKPSGEVIYARVEGVARIMSGKVASWHGTFRIASGEEPRFVEARLMVGDKFGDIVVTRVSAEQLGFAGSGGPPFAL